MWLYHRVMSPNDADGMANSVDPDQTAPLAVRSGSALFCPDLSVRKLRNITVLCLQFNSVQFYLGIRSDILFLCRSVLTFDTARLALQF